MADYFDTVLKPRIQKVAYAAEWRDGKPVAGSAGQSHMFQVIRLESYEDSLNNVRFRELSGPLLATLEKLPDYTLRYMLDFETQGSPSLLDPAQFERPFDYTLDITRDGVTQPRAVDLVATFNFLLGLRVRTRARFRAENGLGAGRARHRRRRGGPARLRAVARRAAAGRDGGGEGVAAGARAEGCGVRRALHQRRIRARRAAHRAGVPAADV